MSSAATAVLLALAAAPSSSCARAPADGPLLSHLPLHPHPASAAADDDDGCAPSSPQPLRFRDLSCRPRTPSHHPADLLLLPEKNPVLLLPTTLLPPPRRPLQQDPGVVLAGGGSNRPIDLAAAAAPAACRCTGFPTRQEGEEVVAGSLTQKRPLQHRPARSQTPPPLRRTSAGGDSVGALGCCCCCCCCLRCTRVGRQRGRRRHVGQFECAVLCVDCRELLHHKTDAALSCSCVSCLGSHACRTRRAEVCERKTELPHAYCASSSENGGTHCGLYGVCGSSLSAPRPQIRARSEVQSASLVCHCSIAQF